MKESKFQKSLKDEIKQIFPDSIILKNDPTCVQGIPDLLILWKDKWASLECKKGSKEKHGPNQDYWVDRLNNMSFSAFIFPENRQEVIDGLKRFFMA